MVWTRILRSIFREVTLKCQTNWTAKTVQQKASIWCEIFLETCSKSHLVGTLTSVLPNSMSSFLHLIGVFLLLENFLLQIPLITPSTENCFKYWQTNWLQHNVLAKEKFFSLNLTINRLHKKRFPLTLRRAWYFKSFESLQTVLLYCSAARQQTSTFRGQKFGLV